MNARHPMGVLIHFLSKYFYDIFMMFFHVAIYFFKIIDLSQVIRPAACRFMEKDSIIGVFLWNFAAFFALPNQQTTKVGLIARAHFLYFQLKCGEAFGKLKPFEMKWIGSNTLFHVYMGEHSQTKKNWMYLT